MAEPLPDDAILGDIEALTVRTRNVLWNRGLFLVCDVRRLSDHELLRLNDIGRRTLVELRAVLAGEEPPGRGDRANPRCCPTCGRAW